MLEFPSADPILVFGGPYSNLRATRALIAEAHRLGIPGDRAICTGDVVAYCAEPEETVAAIRDFATGGHGGVVATFLLIGLWHGASWNFLLFDDSSLKLGGPHG